MSRLSLPGARQGACLLLSILLAGCGGGGGSGAPSANIGGGGGRLQIDSGPLAGTWLDLPAGAVVSDTVFSIRAIDPPELTLAYRAIGPAMRIDPASLPFAAPGELQVPFDLAALAAGAEPADVRLMVWTDDPQAAEFRVPTARDDIAGRARTVLRQTVAVLPVAQVDDPTVPIVEWLPLESGTLFEFDDGSELSIEASSTEPHLQGIELFRLSWTLQQSAEEGQYWRRTPGGQTIYHGDFDLGSGVQSIAIDPVGLLLSEAQLGTLRRQAFRYEFYEAITNQNPTSWGSADLEIRLELVSELDTPLRRFENVVRMTVTGDYGAGLGRQVRELWLARGVGIVAHRLSPFDSRALLVRGDLGGTPLSGD